MKENRNGGSNMKRVSIYAISFLSLCVLLSTSYYMSYRFASRKANNNPTEQETKLGSISSSDVRDVAAGRNMTVTKDTVYTEQVYDIASDECKEEVKIVPNEFVGLNREQVVAKMNQMMQNKSLDEYNKGLVSYQLISFSSGNIVAKKTYNSKGILYKYYMQIMDNEIVVYYSDKTTVCEYTGIPVDNLSDNDREELLYGVWVKDEAELYSTLESYTS